MTTNASNPARRRARTPGRLAALALLSACAAPAGPPSVVSPSAVSPSVEPPSAAGHGAARSLAPAGPAGAETAVSEGGSWRVSWWLEPASVTPAQLFDHGLFDLRVALRTAAGELPGPQVELVVDAGMPQHRHGMNVVPELVPLERGEYRVRGLLFHMPGDWTVTFDVVSGALAERAQAVLEVE